jgi:hypothetical protein
VNPVGHVPQGPASTVPPELDPLDEPELPPELDPLDEPLLEPLDDEPPPSPPEPAGVLPELLHAAMIATTRAEERAA